MFNRLFKSFDGTKWAMSTGTANFIAGGMASNVYWLCSLRESVVHGGFLLTDSLAFDNVKNRIMSRSIAR